MHKTICLRMIQQRPELYGTLLRQGILLSELDRLALQLHRSHQAWKDLLSQARPNSSASQIAGEALEYALKELEEEAFPSESHPEDNGPLSLDAAMAFLRAHTPPA